ncbi:hypothetical protein [Paenibacillus sp. J2TS4]|uniref:hypothetical protein n=1 Tax=Paenibacillus sp. J2TS4 TaxID=2807194 RepID=UPI001B287454|nr:hypothetical protein [Paenibacillus sp. J2TS4]GIP35519.1 hypothetical protein J2TS4_47290 [Paenibacillus sp. J2TS4]
MTYQSKTDWKYDDIVTEQDLNRIESGIQEAHTELNKYPSVPITLNSGLQIITANRDTPLKVTNIQGRTLINLLGRDGNFYNTANWSSYAGSIEANNNTATITGNGTAVNPQIWINHVGPAPALGDRYLLRATMRSRSPLCTNLRLYLWSSTTEKLGEGYQANPVLDKEYDIGSLLTVTQDVIDNWNSLSFRLVAHFATAEDSINEAVDFSKAMLIKIPYADGDLPVSELLEKYPFVDCLQNINAVYIEDKGGNLLPPFIEWEVYGAKSEIIEPYSVRLTTTGNDQKIQYFVKAIPKEKYTFSSSTGFYDIEEYSINRKWIRKRHIADTGDSELTFIVSEDAYYIRISSTILSGSSTKTYSNPMLTINSEPQTFQSQRKSYLYLPTCQLAANLDGSVVDRMYLDNEGKPRVVRQFRRMELTGGMKWWINKASGNLVDYKEVALGIPSPKQENVGVIVKFNGKILNKKPDNVLPEGPDVCTISTIYNNVYITIANSDSGWGPDYEPTQDEIKAYFYGWKMAIAGDVRTSIYNGEGQRSWIKSTMINNPAPLASGDYTGVLPTSPAGTDSQGNSYAPYLLQYQLADPIDEPLEHEGNLVLYEGVNKVEVGAGIVVREKANAGEGLTTWAINNKNVAGTLLKYRTDVIKNVYKNEIYDKTWVLNYDPINSYGNQLAYVKKNLGLYDLSGVYQVTYLALDTYKIGITPTEISAEYAYNLRGTVDSLVEGNKNALARITVLENETAMKEQPQWIAPTLLNRWVNHYNTADNNAGYRINSIGKVEIVGLISGGLTSTGTRIFKLPEGFRPKYNKNFTVWSRETENHPPKITRIVVSGTEAGRGAGDVAFIFGGSPELTPANGWVSLDGIEFPVND